MAIYLGLAIVPVLAALAFLDAGAGEQSPGTALPPGGGGAGSETFTRLLLAVAIILAACAVVGAAFERLGQPAVIGEIMAGILLGPSVFGALWPGGSHWLLPAEIMPQLATLAQLGAILFVFLAGLELDLGRLRGRGSIAVVVSHVSIAVPFLLGVVLALVGYSRFAGDRVEFVPFALFMGVSMSVTALPVMARILMDNGLIRSSVGTMALTCALVDDVTAWCLLAVVVALTTASSPWGVVLTIALAGCFAVVMVFAVRPFIRRVAPSEMAGSRGIVFSLVLAGLLLIALTTELIGVHAIFGAFVFGLICPRDLPIFVWIRQHVGALTTALLLPLFFASSGLRTQLGLLADSGLWLPCLLILAVAVLGKLGGSSIAARMMGVSWPQSLQLGALMNCRGLTELVVLNVGLDLGVLDAELFTMLVVMALVSTAMTAPIVVWLQRRVPQSPASQVG